MDSLVLLAACLLAPSATALYARSQPAEEWSPLSFVVPASLPADILTFYNDADAQRIRGLLEKAAVPGAKPKQTFDFARCHRSADGSAAEAKACLDSGKESVFEAAVVSFPVPDAYLSAPKGAGAEKKNTAKLKEGEKCGVVYAAGLATNSDFEDAMAAGGCEVHGFDCTVPLDRFKDKKWHFHPWCIGEARTANYSSSTYTDGKNLMFKTTDETAKELGNSKIDLLKMDIEGFEYEIIESAIVTGKTLPLQIAFELHTEEASKKFVPLEISKGKGYNQVSHLFLKLFDAGYRIISKQVNRWDPACAEFVVLNVKTLQESRLKA